MVSFVFLMPVYVFLCISGFKLYFHLQIKNTNQTQNKLKKVIITYGLFACFILLEIPFAIFFPTWLSEKLDIVELTSETRIYFLLFGCLVLAFSIWSGRKSRPIDF